MRQAGKEFICETEYKADCSVIPNKEQRFQCRNVPDSANGGYYLDFRWEIKAKTGPLGQD